MTPDVKRRTRGLASSLSAVCRVPFLRFDPLVVAFVSTLEQ